MLLLTENCLQSQNMCPYKGRGVFSTPICANKAIKKQSNQAPSTASQGSHGMSWICPPTSPHPTFFASTNPFSKQIAKLIPYSRKFSLVQIFAERHPHSSEEILIFVEHGTLLTHPYQLMQPFQSVSYRFVGILYSRRLILLYSNHLEGRQTVENHLVHMGSRRMHIMTSSISLLVHFFSTVFIFTEGSLSAKIVKICTQRKCHAI